MVILQTQQQVFAFAYLFLCENVCTNRGNWWYLRQQNTECTLERICLKHHNDNRLFFLLFFYFRDYFFFLVIAVSVIDKANSLLFISFCVPGYPPVFSYGGPYSDFLCILCSVNSFILCVFLKRGHLLHTNFYTFKKKYILKENSNSSQIGDFKSELMSGS